MRRFESLRRRVVSMPEYDGIDGSPARGTGNGVCASWCRCSCEDTGNGVCSCRDRGAASLLRDAVPLRDWRTIGVPVDPCIAPVAALYGSWHWKQGVSGPQFVALQSQRLLGIWSGNAGGESA